MSNELGEMQGGSDIVTGKAMQVCTCAKFRKRIDGNSIGPGGLPPKTSKRSSAMFTDSKHHELNSANEPSDVRSNMARSEAKGHPYGAG